MDTQCAAVDNSWGPWAGDCRGGLDFTLLFEESVFCILPTALLLIAALIHISCLRGRAKTARNGILLPLKQVRAFPHDTWLVAWLTRNKMCDRV